MTFNPNDAAHVGTFTIECTVTDDNGTGSPLGNLNVSFMFNLIVNAENYAPVFSSAFVS